MSLLVSENYRDLYRRAKDRRRAKPAAAAFWTSILAPGPQQPPVDDDRRRVDLHVSILTGNRPQRQVDYVEYKRASRYTPQGKQEAIDQVQAY
ncbi:hypothetical protein AJ80_00072 [Polytolypa hystricis UAMH7299]|uniref:Uncharacterized protein n=1 Tax=Polytolypa hystricis (strain UAMH7299) TaxID=1447883 RepID=A0A2B7Z568_POLH7|nr:hypothetical protein AJ80_00072 [Polytolypa hystricis UAMH7299]